MLAPHALCRRVLAVPSLDIRPAAGKNDELSIAGIGALDLEKADARVPMVPCGICANRKGSESPLQGAGRRKFDFANSEDRAGVA